MSAEKDSKVYAKGNENTGPSSINDDDVAESSSIQNAEKASNTNANNTSGIISPIEASKALDPLKDTIKNLSQLLGIEPPSNLNANGTNSEEGSKKDVRQRPEANAANKTQSNDKPTASNNTTSTTAKTNNKENKSDSKDSSSGLNLSNLNKTAKKFSTDPSVAIKEKAMELGRKFGLELGNLEGQGKARSAETKAKLEEILAKKGSAHPLPNSPEAKAAAQAATQDTTQNTNTDTTATAVSDTTTAPTPIAESTATTTAPTTAPATSTATATPASTTSSGNKQNKGKEDKKTENEDGPPLTIEQAAEHYTKEFKIGYYQGFNDGYTEGAIVNYQENSAETKAARLKDTDAYRDGFKAGEAKMTAAGAETEALIKSYKDKYCKPYQDAKGTPTGPTKQQEDNNVAYNQGFNDGYTNGGNHVINAEKQKKEAEKEDPEYKAGVALAQDSLDNPANLKDNRAKVDKASALFKRGYYQAFNDGFTTKANETIMKERNAFSEETLASGALSIFFNKGVELGKEGRLNPTAGEIKHHFDPIYTKYKTENNPADKDKNLTDYQKSQAEKKMHTDAKAAFNIGMNKGFQGYHEEKQKPKDKSIMFQKAYGIGQIIGYITFKGGNAFLKQYESALSDFFKSAKIDLGAAAKSNSLEQIKVFLIKKTLGGPVPSTIKKDGKDIANPEHKDFTIGYNQGYDDGLKNDFVKTQSDGEAKSDAHESEAYKQGYRDGQQVGKIMAEVSSQVASAADKAAFDAEIQNLTAQAKDKGTDFYRGFNNGKNDGYLATMGGIELETNPSDNATGAVDKIIDKYKAAGDTDMVNRIKKLYDESYKEISEDIYTRLTKPLQASSNEEVKDVTDNDQFDTIPTEADLDKLKIETLGKKLGAQGEVANSYDAELESVDTQLSAAQEGTAEHKKYTDLKATIKKEIDDLSAVYKSVYEKAVQDAKDKGYSYIKGYIEQMRLQGGQVPNIALGKIEKKSDIEYKKGKTAAESYGRAIRMNAMYDASPNSKYISSDIKPQMPKNVVSQAYKEGFEESTMKWTLVESLILGLPIPSSITENEIYKEYEGGSVTAVKAAKQSTDGKNTELPERIAFGSGEKFAIPNNKEQALELKNKITGIAKTDEQYYHAKMLATYYADIVEYTNTFFTDLKDADERALTSFGSTLSDIESMKEDINKMQNGDLDKIKKLLNEKITKFLEKTPEKQRNQYATLINILSTTNQVDEFKKKYLEFLSLASKTKKTRESEVKTREGKKPKAGTIDAPIEKENLDLKETSIKSLEAKMTKLENSTYKNKKSKAYGQENPFTKAKNNIKKIVPEFVNGYKDAIAKVQAKKGISEHMSKENDKYVTDMAYVIGFVEKLAALGIEKNQKKKALNLIKAFIAKTATEVPAEQRVAIEALTVEQFTKKEDIVINYNKALLETINNNKLLKKNILAEESKAKDKGAGDAQLAFNLSTDTFNYLGNMENQAKEGEQHEATIGPLGALAAQYFKNLLPLVKKLIAFADLQKKGTEMQQKIKDMLSMPSIEAEKTYEQFTKLLFNKKLTAGNKEASINVNQKLLTFNYKSANTFKEDSLNNSLELKNASNIRFDLKLNQLEIESTKEVVNIYGNTNEQLGLIGTGIHLAKETKNTILHKPKFIIPSIQSKLIAKDESGKEVKPSNQALLDKELTIGSGKLDLSTDSITSALNKAKKAIIDILNKEETKKTIQ